MTEKEFLKNLVFVIDSREQLPYTFPGRLNEVVCLKNGDYSIKGYEHLIAIERKSIGDLIQSICQERERFERELERSMKLDFFAIVAECSLGFIAKGRYASNMKPAAAIQSIITFQVRYGAQIVYADNRKYAERYTESLLIKYAREQFKKGSHGRT